MIEINQSHANVESYDPASPEQQAGHLSIARMLGHETLDMELRLAVSNTECVTPYWLDAAGHVPVGPEARPFPDPNATLDNARVDPSAGRAYYRMIAKLR